MRVCVSGGLVELLRGQYIDSQGLLSLPPPAPLLPLSTPMALGPSLISVLTIIPILYFNRKLSFFRQLTVET